jgi:hypothetical protein
MGEACLCGQACWHNPLNKLGAGVNSSFHVRCFGSNCNSCNIEKGQALKAANTSTQTGGVKIFDTTHVIFVLVDYPATIHILKDFGVFYACRTLPFTPIYLQNLPLLC